MASPNPADPWSWDAFDPDVPKVDAPKPFKGAPKMFPEEDRLFAAQKNALKAARAAEDLQRALRGKIGAHEGRLLDHLVQDTENTYRVVRSYLDKYVNPSSSL
jgi:hypothetical protein